jgi:hypothetical protein
MLINDSARYGVIIRAAVATLGMIVCACLAMGLSAILLPPASRSLHAPLGVVAALVALFSLQLRRVAKWQFADAIFALFAIEVTIFIAALLSQFPQVPPTNAWRSFLSGTLFVVPAWLLGYAVGSACLIAVERETPVFIRSWVLAAGYALCGLVALLLVPHLRHAYAEFAAPLPYFTLLLIRLSPDLWFLLGLGFAAAAVCKDLVWRQPWLNMVFPIPIMILALTLFLPLL